MPREFGSSLRWRIVYLTINHRVSPSDISRILSVGKTFVHKLLRIYRETGGIEDVRARETRGRPREIDARGLLLIRRLVEQYPELYLDELRDWIEYESGELYSLATLSRYLRRIGLSIKKLQIIAKERDERRRADFRRFIAQFDREQLLFIDESAKDERVFQRKYGQSLKGTRMARKGNFTRGSRYSVLAAISTTGVKASHVIAGAFNRDQFEFAMEQFVLPHVGSLAHGERCSVVVMDNCNIHYSDRIFDMIRQKGGITVFLPPYSPDMNPIEASFGTGKAWLRRHKEVCESYPKRCFEMALEQITPESCQQFFAQCGYM